MSCDIYIKFTHIVQLVKTNCELFDIPCKHSLSMLPDGQYEVILGGLVKLPRPIFDMTGQSFGFIESVIINIEMEAIFGGST